MRRVRGEQGFSLIELAVVIGIISLILGFGLSMANDAIKAAKRVNTQQRLATVQEAIEHYIRVNGYLPCPADRALTPNSPNFGIEQRTGAACNSGGPGLVHIAAILHYSDGFIGAVPIRTLGLPDSYAADAWGGKLTYAASGSYIANPASYQAPSVAMAVYRGDRTGTHYMLSTQQGLGTSQGGPTATYVVISHGPDQRGAFPLYGSAVAIPCGNSNRNDVENCDDSNVVFYDTDYNDGTNDDQYFDDYVVWGSNQLWMTPASTAMPGCPAGSCEAWCATCTSPDGVIPSDMPTGGAAALTNPVLCQKILTSVSPCMATCMWSGTVTADSTYVRCP